MGFSGPCRSHQSNLPFISSSGGYGEICSSGTISRRHLRKLFCLLRRRKRLFTSQSVEFGATIQLEKCRVRFYRSEISLFLRLSATCAEAAVCPRLPRPPERGKKNKKADLTANKRDKVVKIVKFPHLLAKIF